MNSEEKAHFLLDVVEDRKAVDPVLLDLRGKTVMTDFFLVCSGTSNVHIRSIADGILEKSEEADLAKPRVEGQANAEWVLLDFGDVVLHVMAEEPRRRYRLEQFWSTPHPKGALPPTPGAARADDADVDAADLDEEDRVDAAFFDEADQEVAPIDEDEEDFDEDEDVVSIEDLEEEEDEDEEEFDDTPRGLPR
jgi:ribosome-associated protein